MTRHSRHASASQSASYMPVGLQDAALYSQSQSRLGIPENYFDPNPSPTTSMMPTASSQYQDAYDLYQSTSSTNTMSQHQAAQQLLQPSASFTSHRASSGAWTREDDRQLLQARAKGLNWGQVKDKFSNKSANACRKRHERLMERKDADDWDNRKMEQLAKEYMSMRKEIWAPLASRVGEKWNVVEAKCLSNGLKNLQSASRSASRRDRQEGGALSGYDDDSGISGIGLTPVDELDHPPYHSSPDASPSGSHSSSGRSQSHAVVYGGHHHQHLSGQPHVHHRSHQQQQHLQVQQHYAGAGSYPYVNGYGSQSHHGYSSSVSSTASMGRGGYHQRLSSAERELGLINPSGGGRLH